MQMASRDLNSGHIAARPIQSGNHTFGVVICYEIGSPSLFAARAGDVNWMLLISDMSWFPSPDAAAHHRSMARWRAAETGRWLLSVSVPHGSMLVNPAGETVEVPATHEQLWRVYDAATGAAREVRYGPAQVTLTDLQAASGRAPDCLAYTVHHPVTTTIWGSDGYRYEIRLGSPSSADRARRSRMGHPDDLNWRVLPVDLSAQPHRTIAGASCRDFPTAAQALGGVTDLCRLEPNDDIVFRNLPLALREVTVTGVLNGVPNASSEEHTLTATSITTDRARFGEWGNGPVDALPVLPPGVTITD